MSDEPERGMGIAEVAHRAGVTPRTIRYYVAEGLLPPAVGRGQRRAYGREHLDRLETIRQLKAAYLPLHEIRRRLDAPTPAPGESPVRGRGERDAAPARSGHEVVSEPAPLESMPPVAVASAAPAASRPPIGFGGAPGVGRIEIFDPPETVWRRHVLAPGVELHYRETDDPGLAEAIQRLIREAGAILDGRPLSERSAHHVDVADVD